jgi:hypothetical protein
MGSPSTLRLREAAARRVRVRNHSTPFRGAAATQRLGNAQAFNRQAAEIDGIVNGATRFRFRESFCDGVANACAIKALRMREAEAARR